MKKFILTALLLMFGTGAGFSQVKSVVIGVDGFTCSLCAKGVEEQFKSLSFVNSVKTDIKASTFTLNIKNNKSIDVAAVRDAVSDGGFSVRSIEVTASGTISSNGSGYKLKTKNSQDINLSGIAENLKEGDKVTIKGNLTSSGVLSVSSVKKN